MAKQKITYTCKQCSYQSVKWLGCCTQCQAWDSFEEQRPTPSISGAIKGSSGPALNMVQLTSIAAQTQKRMISGIDEFDRVVGGGIMAGSLLILTGDPGIGKSTLLLQISDKLACAHRVFYFSSEESLAQVKLRATRLGCTQEKLLFSDKANLQAIITTAAQEKPDIVIIDSIQNCYNPNAQTLPGSTGQLREAAFNLMRLAKENDITVIISGHITKEGNMAGPKTLEHMVDGVFYLQGEDRFQTRVLRSVKNRFGTVNELGFFQMSEHGLQEVPNINEHLLQQASYAPGSMLISYIEGSRPLLIELQALTIPSKFGVPQRVITGIDHKQVVLIAAILEKYLQIKLSAHDIFFKVAGNFKIKESSADLGIALALLSSYFQKELPTKSVALGEISLTGQIKAINQVGIHINEAQKFGIACLMLAKQQQSPRSMVKTMHFTNVYELMKLFSQE